MTLRERVGSVGVRFRTSRRPCPGPRAPRLPGAGHL